VTPLVLLPGMGCSGDLWADLDLDVEPVTPQLEESDLDAEVERLLALLPGRFALAGLSLGAIVAMALVRRAPERVERLCLLSTNPHGPTPEQLAGWSAQRQVLAAGSARALQQSLLPLLVQRRDLEARVLAMAEEVGTDRYDAQLRLQATRVDERPALARVACPTLVVAARDDRLCPLTRHEEIVRLVPGAELVVVEACAHLSPLEQPAAVSGWLRYWLERSTPSSQVP
jgi:pimeloyl-ACP methyl ester carboxylesterase